MTLLPAEPNTGVVFLTAHGEIPAQLAYVAGTNRGTVLRSGRAEVRTVEHLLGALAGLRVDNARIEIEGPEAPVADGSALPFVELIQKAGIEEQPLEAGVVRIGELT